MHAALASGSLGGYLGRVSAADPVQRQPLPPLPAFDPPASLKGAEAAIFTLGRNMDEHAYLLGKHLIWLQAERKKQRVPGKWEEYVENKFWFSRRKARYLMAHAKDCKKKNCLLPYDPGAPPKPGDEFYSPESVIEPARVVLGGFDLDPASCATANKKVKAREYYSLSEGRNGLDRALPWEGRLWMNPPYTDLAQDFAERLSEEYQEKQRVTAAILLLSTRHLNMPWFDWLWMHGTVCFPLRQLEFTGPDGKPRYTKEGNVVVYVGEDSKRFEEIFSAAGDGGGPIGHFMKSDVLMTTPASAEEVAAIDAAAAKMGITRSEYMRRVLGNWARRLEK